MPPDAPPSPRLASERGYATSQEVYEGVPINPAEPSPELVWPDSIPIFEKMRYTDGRVGAVMRAVLLSIGRLSWHVDGRGCDPAVVEHIHNDTGVPVLGETEPDAKPMRRKGRFSFREHISLATDLSLTFGHSFFEQVYRIEDDGFAHLRKLGVRMPQTIAAINVDRDGGLKSIEQYPVMGGATNDRRRDPFKKVELKVNRLVSYNHGRQGGNWAGVSLLRPLYANWLLKDRLLRVDTAAMQRNGMGVPWITAPEGATDTQMKEYAAIAAAFRAGEEAGGAGPAGSKMELVGVSGAVPDVLARIKYHDSQIAQNFFAQFLELGQTNVGSRSLGESFVDFFMVAIDAIAAEIADVFNAHVIEDLIDINYGEDEPAPRVVAAPAKERKSLAATELIAMAQAGLLAYDPGLEAYVRERYGLPFGDGSGRTLIPVEDNPELPRNLPDAEGNSPSERSDGVEPD